MLLILGDISVKVGERNEDRRTTLVREGIWGWGIEKRKKLHILRRKHDGHRRDNLPI